jgi:hypothetical protein
VLDNSKILAREDFFKKGGGQMAVKKQSKRDKIYASLMEQLAFKGASVDCFEDLIQDYMSLWDTKNALIADIRKRGVMYKDVSSVGVEMMKNNPSVKELVMVNKQMLMLLKELDLSTENAAGGDPDDDL